MRGFLRFLQAGGIYHFLANGSRSELVQNKDYRVVIGACANDAHCGFSPTTLVK